MKIEKEFKQINEDELKQVSGGAGVFPGESKDEAHLENLTDNVGDGED